ncbi:beta-lactamase [Rufibacter sp. DG15C]|uniref:serine hydrolase domain-containing protein n=1 Tax=Rufibacter sp. DG15C TaxID=1379909 RepID=UPI00078BF164|nr:serine hydrolase [Rufibacter sp. DG15C]AMM50847.1 beta-lactamase [Rufibacter sp. DG15C]
MKRTVLAFAFICLSLLSCKKDEVTPAPTAQNLYFPAVGSSIWETSTPESLGWSATGAAALDEFLNQSNTRAFLLLKDGKIVIEYYNGKAANGTTFTANSNWYWASAGKTLNAFLIGKAQEDGHLSIQDKTSKYLGAGWTSLTPAQEDKITIRHQLTMTTGLNDLVPNHHCYTPSCLTYKADAGTRWAYHNGPYTLLTQVTEKATKQDFDTYFKTQLADKIGMGGFWMTLGDDYVYFSTARAMARFGLLMLNKGTWDKTVVLKDTEFFKAMTSPSQNLNRSYGYLWWLNGQSSFMLPTSQMVFSGSAVPDAPVDMIAAMGKNGQFLNIVPSQNLILVRMGDNPDDNEVPVVFLNDLWKKVNAVIKK